MHAPDGMARCLRQMTPSDVPHASHRIARRTRMNLGFEPAALLEPLCEESPCGENMEYSPEFTAMLAPSGGKPGQQVRDANAAAAPPQWPEVVERCQAL